MKINFLLLSVVATIIFFTLTSGNVCTTRNISFKAGESIKYKAYYHLGAMDVGAGEATFTTVLEKLNNKPVYHVTGEGHTHKGYDWIFKVRDTYESFIDTNSLLPLKFLRNVNEGGYKIYNNVTFNDAMQTATSTNGVFKVPKCTQDVLSTIFFARNIDFNKLKVDDKIPFDMFIDDAVYNIYIRYLGKEKIKIGLGTFNAIKFRPLLISGTLFNGGEKMVVWVTDDANHIPLRIESPIRVGDIRADLIEAKGLRNNLTSWISRN
jgi:Protein of unknown function (DUF3108)